MGLSVRMDVCHAFTAACGKPYMSKGNKGNKGNQAELKLAAEAEGKRAALDISLYTK